LVLGHRRVIERQGKILELIRACLKAVQFEEDVWLRYEFLSLPVQTALDDIAVQALMLE